MVLRCGDRILGVEWGIEVWVYLVWSIIVEWFWCGMMMRVYFFFLFLIINLLYLWVVCGIFGWFFLMLWCLWFFLMLWCLIWGSFEFVLFKILFLSLSCVGFVLVRVGSYGVSMCVWLLYLIERDIYYGSILWDLVWCKLGSFCGY